MIFIELFLHETDSGKRNSRPILINMQHIVSVHRDHDGHACVYTSDGQFSNVAETYEHVVSLIKESGCFKSNV